MRCEERRRGRGSVPPPGPRHHRDTDLRRILFVPDTHVPFEDRRAWAVMLAAAKEFQPHVLVHLGDLGDCYSISAHSKDPRRMLSWTREAEAVRARRRELDDIGAKEKWLTIGNHEFRLKRHLEDAAPALHDRLSIDGEYELSKHGWNVVPYREHAKIGKIYITHEHGNAGALANVKARDKFQSNAVIGHTHRMGLMYQGNARGEQHVGCAFGWLGDIRKIDYTHRVTAAEWTLGFGLGFMQPSGVVHVQAIPIIGYQAVVSGEVVRA